MFTGYGKMAFCRIPCGQFPNPKAELLFQTFSTCKVASAKAVFMLLAAIKTDFCICNSPPDEQNAHAKHVQELARAGFANAGGELDRPKAIQPYS